MRDVGVWYFEAGWIIVTIIGLLVGLLAIQMERHWVILAFSTSALVLGIIMLYAKSA